MGFQSTVNYKQGFGVVGEIYRSGPFRGQSLILDSADAANNVIGRAFTVKSEGRAQAGGDGGVFAGILANPKVYPLQGTAVGGSLAPSLTLPNEAQAEFITVGEVIVYFENAFTAGQGVFYDDDTGKIYAGTASTHQTQISGAYVSHYTSDDAGLGVVTLNTQQS